MAAAPSWPWLTARPIAHRGLHAASAGLIENSVSAADAAIARNFAIECDVQWTADGEAVVFHDFTLDRLTAGQGRVDALTADALGAVAFQGTPDRMPTLATFLARIGARVPLVCEIKSRFDGDMRLAERTAAVVAASGAPVGLKSFDPRVVAHLRAHGARLGLSGAPLGIVAQAEYDYAEWASMAPDEKRALANFLHFSETRPDFISYHVKDLPHAAPYLCRVGLGLPVMTWTVRDKAQQAHAALWADQIVFEGFTP